MGVPFAAVRIGEDRHALAGDEHFLVPPGLRDLERDA
jgi:hypothetical protein